MSLLKGSINRGHVSEATSRKKRGRRASPAKSVTVRVAISPALKAHLQRLVDFGRGRDVAEVMRNIATHEVTRLQDEGRLPDLPGAPDKV
jgi:hypothetical protein